MNVLVDKMVQEGLIEESAARGIYGALAKGEPPARAFAAAGLAEEELLRFLAREFRCPYIELETCSFSREFLSQFPARVLLEKHVIPLDSGNGASVVINSLHALGLAVHHAMTAVRGPQ